MAKFTTAATSDGKFAILPAAGLGMIIGTRADLRALHDALARLLDGKPPAAEIEPYDLRLGHVWLNVNEAADEAKQLGYPEKLGSDVSATTIRWAARKGRIPGARQRKAHGDWLVPYSGLIDWLENGGHQVGRPRNDRDEQAQ